MRCAMFDVCMSPFIPIHSIHSQSVPFQLVCCVQDPPPAVGQAPDLMTNAHMAALVAPIDAAVLFPFYADVNITNAKFRWYKTGQLEKQSKSFYAVPACGACGVFVFSCHSTRAPMHPHPHPRTLVPSYHLVFLFCCCNCDSAHT